MISAPSSNALQRRLLLVEDDPAVRHSMREFFGGLGFAVAEAEDVPSTRRALAESMPDAIVLDYSLKDGPSLELLTEIRDAVPAAAIVMLTGLGSIDLAVRAMQQGADHFLTKPLQLPALQATLERLIVTRRSERRAAVEQARRDRQRPDPFLGTSAAIRRLEQDARRVVETEGPVLVLGPTGSGKDVLAQWLHREGPRGEELYVDINCASLNRDFLETELFGHRRGAFTGAHADKPGLLEMAHRGTLFLDEIGELDPGIQAKLLRVLENGRFRRMGDLTDRHADVRLVAATNRDLPSLAKEGTFRPDLYFRISTFPLRMPSLAERRDDIPAIAGALLESLRLDVGRPHLSLEPEAVATLERYDWPGNIREMRNVLERALILTPGEVIEASALRFESSGGPAPGASPHLDATLDWTLEDVEKFHIVRVLKACNGHVETAAGRLGVPRSTLYDKLRRFGISNRRLT